ncbi:YciI family protein [Chryseobacterium sp. MP_3.2]|uniref:YciI family protein n=1 Tax=Chryseobacterium sp. MP_3.2 TaxID=3071712 RepID=UPI002E04FC39|nr:uncharacterized protein YciI [Chryseobacterium sp. MP_3.2]
MKSVIITLAFFVCVLSCNAQQKVAENPKTKNILNHKLADSLGADERGMKSYMLVILKTGPNDDVFTDKAKREELFKGHFANMSAMEKYGQLKLAGPFATKNDLGYRGIFLLDVKTEEEAKVLLQNDPTIKAGIFEVEILPWYGSAAIPMHLKYHKQIAKENP